MKKKERILSVFLVLSLLVSTFCLIGTDSAYAASKKKKAAKNIKVTIVSASTNSVTMTWNKIKKPYKGYAVFRNGVPIAHLGKKATSFTDNGLSAGTYYSYQIKSYKVKKARKKKPKKYTYKKKSNIASVTTSSSPMSSAEIAREATHKIYNYILKNGHTVNSNYRNYIIGGDLCIESAVYTGVELGDTVKDTFIISIDRGNPDLLRLCAKRVIMDNYHRHVYDNTIESYEIEFNVNNPSGKAYMRQAYYTSDSYSSLVIYSANGDVTYSNYTGNQYSDQGITCSKGNLSDLKKAAYIAAKGNNQLLYNLFGISLNNLGFSHY